MLTAAVLSYPVSATASATAARMTATATAPMSAPRVLSAYWRSASDIRSRISALAAVQLGVPNCLLLGERLGYGLPNGVGDNRLQVVVFGDVRRNQLPLPYDAGNQLLIDSVLLFPEADSSLIGTGSWSDEAMMRGSP